MANILNEKLQSDFKNIINSKEDVAVSFDNMKQNHKPIVQKKPPDILCNCPQKCDLRVPQDIRSSLYREFCNLGDHIRQNTYLQSYIEMRSVYKRLWCQEERIGGRLQRRVSCKYKVPLEMINNNLNNDIDSSPKLTTNSKGQATIIVGQRDPNRTIEVCQKAFMNVYGITEKRIRLQREKLIARLRADNVDNNQVKSDQRRFHHPNSIISSSATTTTTTTAATNTTINRQITLQNNNNDCEVTDHDDDELSIVDTFFRNQLWKPEYIGISTDKLNTLELYYNNVRA